MKVTSAWLALCAAALFPVWPAGAQQRLNPLPGTDQNMTTGPAVGQPVPAFEAADQNGKTQTLETLRGARGLVLMFVRSADW